MAYGNIRYEGVGQAVEQSGISVAEMDNSSVEPAESYEGWFFPVSHREFIRQWLHQSNAIDNALLN